MGRLLEELGKKLTHKAENDADDPLKILVHSTHDTGVAPLLNTLDVFDERFVPLLFLFFPKQGILFTNGRLK